MNEFLRKDTKREESVQTLIRDNPLFLFGCHASVCSLSREICFFMENRLILHPVNMASLFPAGIFLTLLLSGCTSNRKSNERLEQKIDSLQSSVQALQQQLAKSPSADSALNVNLRSNDSLHHVAAVQAPLTQNNPSGSKTDSIHPKTTERQAPRKEKKPPKADTVENKTVFHYYQSEPKRVAVEITPWNDGKREILFFNSTGDTTYSIEDIMRSYSSVTQLRFHKSGACSSAETSMNPGASMYWYETKITFDENNTPLWKTETQMPMESIEQNMNNKWWWNSASKSWVRQEIIKEQPLPH